MKESFLLLNKEDINFSIPKKVIILFQAHTQTHTRTGHTHIHKHVPLKFAVLNVSYIL